MGAYYELVELLGEGGMGRVYRAVHHPSGAQVAVKTLRSEVRHDAMRRRLLLDEASAAARLDHPAIVRMLDVGREPDGAPFLVMELASGTGLEAWLMRWPGWTRFAAALDDVLDALAVAHANGIVHCDLKPPNVLVDPATGRARILDFGVATLLDPLRGLASERIAGTPEFMPPEQLTGRGPIGPWTDLYAFGVMLAYAVRGSSPFESPDEVVGLLAQKLDRSRETRHDARPGLIVPEELQVLIDRLIAPHPRARPRFAAEVARELAEISRHVIDEIGRSTDPDPIPVLHAPTTLDTVLPSGGLSGVIAPTRHSDGPLPEPAPAATSEVLALPSHLPASDDVAATLGLREAPFVGRDDERLEIESMVMDVIASGSSALLGYLGEAGVGKSRLARWGLAYVERKGLMEGTGGGYDASGTDVAGGLRHALARLLGGTDPSSWSWLPDEPGLDRAALAAFVRADESSGTLPRERVVQLVHAALRSAASVRPLYLWLDDLGWAGDGAIEVVQRLLEDDVPVLIVATLRAGTDHRRAGEIARLLTHSRSRVRELERLGAAERAALLDGILPMATAVAHALASKIDGSPALLEQLVRDRVQNGMLVPGENGLFEPAPGISLDAIASARPLRALVADRIDAFVGSMAEREREAVSVLVRAALLGARFELSALRAACARDRSLAAALDDVLDRALMAGLLRTEHGQVYAFDHGLVHEILISRAARQKVALADAANGLQARYGKDRADIGALVAGLLRRAGDHERAWERQLRAIERAAWASDDAAARKYLETARQWAVEEPAAEARVLYQEARVHYFALRYDESLAVLTRARDLARAQGDLVLAARCDTAEADTLYYQDRFGEAERLARQAVAAASIDDPETAEFGSLAAHRLADVAMVRRDLEDAERWRRRAIAFAEVTGAAWRVRVMRLNLAELYAAQGRLDDAWEIQRAVMAEAEEARDDDSIEAARDTELRVTVLEGNGARVRDALAARIVALEAASDAWRVSAVSPFLALAQDDDAALAGAAAHAIRAVASVPCDETLIMVALRKLIDRLVDAGAIELATELATVVDSREEAYRKGFEHSR